MRKGSHERDVKTEKHREFKPTAGDIAVDNLDSAAMFRMVERIGQDAESPSAGWRAMCDYAATLIGAPELESVAMLDVDAEAARIRTRVKELLEKESPPPHGVDTLMFGLFDRCDPDVAHATAGYYVAGIIGYDPKNSDSMCDPAWWPEGRYLDTPVQKAIMAARSKMNDKQYRVMDYALRFGAAFLVSRFAAEGLPYRILVSFDDGDFAEVARPAGTKEGTTR